MKKKLLGVFVCMLLIATAIPAVGTMNEKEISTNNPIEPLQPPWWGLDQKQTQHDNIGFEIKPSQWLAQGFKPTMEKLTAVQLRIFKHGDPPNGIEITVSIRDNLNGSDLTVTSEIADQIEKWKWVTFDFPDITVTPENKYYIVCRSDGGVAPDVYCWSFKNNNPYDRGDAWGSTSQGLTWFEWGTTPDWQDPDLCFKTFTKKSKDIAFDINTFFLRFLENHPYMFPILRHMLGL